MKKIKPVIISILAAAIMICAAFGLSACSERSNISALRVENAKISFLCGEQFETGADFKVFADYKDGTSADVTADVTVRQERGMDMNVAGDYQITVAYGDKRVIYTVYVNASADVLRKLELDTSAVKTTFMLGDAVSFDGLALDLTYENEHGATYSRRTSSLADFVLTVTDANGRAAGKVFSSLGAYTVTVSQGNVRASFPVTVDGVNLSTVGSALTVGGFFADTVVSGSAHVRGAQPVYDEGSPLQPGELFTSAYYEYTFGNDYTYFKETHNPPVSEYHCSVDDEGLFVVYLADGVIGPTNRENIAMMDGVPMLLWYSGATEYGVENALVNLYEHALTCSNDDLKETVDADTRTFTFEFSGLVFRTNSADYYENSVSFTLGENYAVKSARITQYYYENNSSLAGQPGYVPTFTTDPETGKTTPTADYTYRTEITVEQTAGTRTAQNIYGRDMFDVASYKLMYNGEELTDESVLECEAGQMYTFTVADVLPATANLAVDRIQFDYEGNRGFPDFWLSNEHFALVSNGSAVTLSVRHGGEWTLLFRTRNTVKKLKINVRGEAPEDMQPKLYNPASGSFYDGSEISANINSPIYFYGAVSAYSDPSQTATVTSENGESVTITDVTMGGVACMMFTASQPGTYQITVTSDAQALVRCIFTFSVGEQPDFAAILSGTYTVQDRVGDIYHVTFTQTAGVAVSGTVEVTRTPTDLNNDPLPDQAVSQTLTFTVEGTNIVVTHGDNDSIWVEFDVDVNGDLVLIDQRETRYVMTKV